MFSTKGRIVVNVAGVLFGFLALAAARTPNQQVIAAALTSLNGVFLTANLLALMNGEE